MRTKIFFDAEFTGLHQKTTLISIALIAETGQRFYGECTDFDQNQLNDWLMVNVMPHIGSHNDNTTQRNRYLECVSVGPRQYVANDLREWLSQFGEVEMWSDCLHYDWVLFCELFGGAQDLPANILYIPFDICTIFRMKDIDPDINREQYVFGIIADYKRKHHAMWDAEVIMKCYQKLMAT